MKAISIKTGKIFSGKLAVLMVNIGAAKPQEESVLIVPKSDSIGINQQEYKQGVKAKAINKKGKPNKNKKIVGKK